MEQKHRSEFPENELWDLTVLYQDQEDFLRAIGAEPVVYANRNECCGGYVTLSKKELAQKKADTILASAMEMGAEEIITACPLCMYNLDANSTEHKLPIHYFTELLAEALGVK